MARKLGRDEILNRLLEAAIIEWSREAVEEMRPAFETAAEAIWEVEQFQLEPEEEPALLTLILQRERRGRVE